LIILTGRVTTPAPSTVCADQIPNCKDYTSTVCTGQYASWAQFNCPKFCNLCGRLVQNALLLFLLTNLKDCCKFMISFLLMVFCTT